MPNRILIVDDERDMLTLLRRMISEERDYEIITESDPRRALERFRAEPVELVMTDLKMPGMDGIALLEAVKTIQPKTAVIVLTAFATIETAVEATRKGAFDYITKPFRQERILLTVDKAMQWQEIVRRTWPCGRPWRKRRGSPRWWGHHRSMRTIFERIRQVAPTMGTVLITGPSGTGQGTGGPRHPPAQPAPAREDGDRELHGDPPGGPGKRAVRPRQGGFHRRLEGEKGARGGGPRGDALPGRDRGPARRTCRPSCCGCFRRESTSRSAAS